MYRTKAIDRIDRRRIRRRNTGLMAGVLLSTLALGACDLDLADPASLEDQYMDNPVIYPALLRGVRGSFTYATAGPVGGRGVYLASALLTDEAVHSGLEPGLRAFSDGIVSDEYDEVTELWAEISRARWTAEDLVGRFERLIAETDPANESRIMQLNEYLAETLIWAGFAGRVLGDNFCEAVINKGPSQPRTVYYERAEEFFTRALDIAVEYGLSELELLALAGRAQVRVQLGDWAGAVDDAALVPVEFVYNQIHYYPSERETNGFRSASLPANPVFTIWGTPFADWGRQAGTTTGDPRVPYTVTSGLVGLDTRRPFYQQTKYNVSAASIAIAKGTEMRLIEAEALLVGGDWQGAVAKIQEVRDYRNSLTTVPTNKLPDIVAADADEAWHALMVERGIELWLEGRRLGDMRRWTVTPGKDKVNFNVVRKVGSGGPETDEIRNVLDVPGGGELCLPISRIERLTNPNL